MNDEFPLLVIFVIPLFCMAIMLYAGEKKHKSFRRIAHEIWLDDNDPRMSNSYNDGY